MTTVYKLTDENMRTYGGCQWEIGVAKTSSGEGELCGPGWLHAYTDPLLAVFLNPLYAKFKKPRLFECEGDVGKTDHGLKIGCTRLTLVREIPVPVVTVEQRVRFAILCAMEVYHDPKWRVWALSRLSGEDRSARASASAAELASFHAALIR